MFNWLDAVHTEWIALPLKEIYQLAHECYVKTLPTDMIPPPSSIPLSNIPDMHPLGYLHPSSTLITPSSHDSHMTEMIMHPKTSRSAAFKLSTMTMCSDAPTSPATTQKHIPIPNHSLSLCPSHSNTNAVTPVTHRPNARLTMSYRCKWIDRP